MTQSKLCISHLTRVENQSMNRVYYDNDKQNLDNCIMKRTIYAVVFFKQGKFKIQLIPELILNFLCIDFVHFKYTQSFVVVS